MGREDYLAERYKQLYTYIEVKKQNDKLLSQLTEKSTKFFKTFLQQQFDKGKNA